MSNCVIYTAIFGGYDLLQEPTVIPKGFDFVCFSDRKIDSKVWETRVVEPVYEDSVRNARMYKILPHRYLGSYETSVWIDGNLLVRGDVNKLIREHLSDVNMAVYNHISALHRDRKKTSDSVSSVEEQVKLLLSMAERGRAKDDPELIKHQFERYQKEGFPDDNGLLLSMVLLRRHNDPKVIETMELWWNEIKNGSKRDQISFNYAAWKSGLEFTYIKENVRENKYFLHLPHH